MATSLKNERPLADGQYRNEVFPGLGFNSTILLASDMVRALEVLQTGLSTDEYARFVAQMREA